MSRSGQSAGDWFRFADYQDRYGRSQKADDTGRDGFTLLVMDTPIPRLWSMTSP